MIDVGKEIRNALRTQYPEDQYDVYTEGIEQGFAEPCFAIHQLRADVTPYPNRLTEIVQHFAVRFSPKGSGRVSSVGAWPKHSRFCCGNWPACAVPD